MRVVGCLPDPLLQSALEIFLTSISDNYALVTYDLGSNFCSNQFQSILERLGSQVVVGGILLEYNPYSNISAFSGILGNKLLREVFQYRILWNAVFHEMRYSSGNQDSMEYGIPEKQPRLDFRHHFNAQSGGSVTVRFTCEPTLLYSEE
jgi:hypothetical protein